MSNHLLFHGYPYPFIPVSGNIKTSGQWGDLRDAAGSVSVGIYDAKSYGVATSSGSGKEFFIGYSSEHSVDKLTNQLSRMKDPNKNQDFKGSDVISFEYSDPVRAKNEVWAYGYNGAPSSKSLSFQSGTTYGIQIKFSDSPIWRVFGKSLVKEFWITTEPGADPNCASGCEDGVDCEKYTNQFADAINADHDLAAIGVKARVRLSSYESPEETINIYQITINDGCGDTGLAVVQAVVGRTGTVRVVSKVDCATTYEVCAVSAPASITPLQQYSITGACTTCPTGYTLVPAIDNWIVRRPLAGTENLVGDANQDTYADTVGTAYASALSVSISDAQKTFLGQDGAVATVKIQVPVGTAVVALLSDTVEKAASSVAVCISNTTPVAVTWSDIGDAFRTQRDLTITLPRLDCAAGSNRLAELTAFVEQYDDYVDGSITVSADNDNCADDYTISQWSVGCAGEGCLNIDRPSYLDFPGYAGEPFKVAPIADIAESGKKCGLEIYAGYVDSTFSNCSFDPYEFYEMQPIRMIITGATIYPFPTPVQIGQLPSALKMQEGAIGRQSGEWAVREYIKSGAYEKFGSFWKDSRVREAMNSRRLVQLDRSAYYKVYYLKHKSRRDGTDQKQEIFEPRIVFKENDIQKQINFENAFLAVLGKFSVTLKQRDLAS